MSAIFRREFRAYFTSPVGFVVIAIVFLFTGFFFTTYNIYSLSPDLSYVFSSLFPVALIILPILTMRLFSDEKRMKTDQVLLTSPVSIGGIIMGKFLAAFLVFALSLILMMVFAMIIAFQVMPDWLVIIGNYLGILLVGGLVISIGLLISSITESQLIAAIGTLAISLILLLMDGLASLLNFSLLIIIANFISISQRYSSFTSGIIAYDDIIFFLSMQALFLFLTARVLDKKRWS
ncbi:MAG: ABC transporter permease [Oscillospiraceae bacterium]|nr:ABC transporter permease [Oscillospiraceae bacterium]MDD3832333.1 ABC transporter permease [Oscillospiraceae bacterium]MDD4545750.1 ABC transporter permease [Oscillospiraceae bacterium]